MSAGRKIPVRCGKAVIMILAAVLLFLLQGDRQEAAYLSPPQDMSRRMIATGALMSVIGAPLAAQAAQFPLIGKDRGPFEVDPKDAVIVEDIDTPRIKDARIVIKRQNKLFKEALEKITADPQADLTYIIEKLGISDIRWAVNGVADVLDNPSMLGVYRLQRLMIQNQYMFDDDIPMPTNKKGKVFPRGPKRVERVRKCLTDYAKWSDELLQFLPDEA